MTERYGSGYGDEGQRPSGRGAVTERLAGQPDGAHEIDLTDEAATRETAEYQTERESSGAFEPAADSRPGSSNIFDVDQRDKEEDLNPTGYEPPVADAEAEVGADEAEAAPVDDSAATAPEGAGAEPAATEPGPAAEADAGDESGEITPTPVPVAEPPAGATGAPGLPEPPAATDAAEAAAAPGTTGSLLGSLDAAELRNRFLDIQAGFVDEPRQAVEEAGRFVDDLVGQVAESIQEQRRQLAGATPEGSTEDLRLALRAYRQFVDRLLSMAN